MNKNRKVLRLRYFSLSQSKLNQIVLLWTALSVVKFIRICRDIILFEMSEKPMKVIFVEINITLFVTGLLLTDSKLKEVFRVNNLRYFFSVRTICYDVTA